MSEFEYYLLDIGEKAELVFSEGIGVATLLYYNQKVELYSLFNFWVEVYYSLEDNMIDNIQIAGGDEMQKYLSKIKIDESQ